MLHPWAEIESTFTRAVLGHESAPPSSVQGQCEPRAIRGFEVYRNNYRVNLREALQASHPVTAQLVGEEFFAAMAGIFISLHPPRSPVLIEYGGELSAFIEKFEPAGGVPYLSDVALLEAAWSTAYHAPEAKSLGADALVSIQPATLAESCLRLHPSVQLMRSAYPVASIWAAHQPSTGPRQEMLWSGEDVLVVRPDAEVLVLALNPGHWRFYSGLQVGQNIEQAALFALEEAPEFNPGSALLDLLTCGAVCGLVSATAPAASE